MKKTVTYLLTLGALLLCSACSWVKDDLSDCPTGNWLHLSYAYNLLNVDAASTQVSNVSLFIYQEDGTLVRRENVDSVELHRRDCKIEIPKLPEGKYDFLIWGGMEDSLYRYTDETLELLTDGEGVNEAKLPSLFHGRLDGVHITDSYNVYEFPLMKNTNVLSCLVQSQADTASFKSELFRLEVKASNARMNHWNMPVDSVEVMYLPFYKDSASIENFNVLQYGVNTLRLMEEDDTRLKLVYVPTGKAVLDIPLTEYLLLSRHVDFASMPSQEYLDRQDRYDIIFFLSEKEDPELPFVCLSMKVNGWIVRFDDAELE